MAEIPVTQDEIDAVFPKVAETMADALGCDVEDIKADVSLIGRIYSFADWCMQAPRGPDAGHDPMSAVTVAFYEDIPTFKPARDDMPRWFPYAEVANNRQVFAYHIGDAMYDELVEHMAKNRHGYQSRP